MSNHLFGGRGQRQKNYTNWLTSVSIKRENIIKQNIFMKNRTLLTIALLASSLVGCSKNSTPLPKAAASADLGVVEVADGNVNRVALSDGRIFVVRSAILKDQKMLIGDQVTVLKGQNISLMRKEAAIALACLFANAVFAQETQMRLDSTRYDFGKVLAGTRCQAQLCHCHQRWIHDAGDFFCGAPPANA